MKEEMGFKEIFDDFFSSADIGSKKPEIKFYEDVLNIISERDGLQKEDILFIDDSRENIEAAAKFGIKSWLYSDFDDFIENHKFLLPQWKPS